MEPNISSLLIDTSRSVADQVCNVAIQRPEVIRELLELALEQKGVMALRTSNVLALIADSKPELLAPYLESIIKAFPELEHHSVKRAFTRIVSRYPLIEDEDLLSILTNHCFDWLNDADETIAIRVYSMEILSKVCSIYPDIIPELKQTIELHYDDGSAGFKAHSIKVLKKL